MDNRKAGVSSWLLNPKKGGLEPPKGAYAESLDDVPHRPRLETILEVAQLDLLRVEVILPSSMVGKIAKGGSASIVPEIPGDVEHAARVTIVDRVIDAASGTFGVQLELPNPDDKILGGLHCRVRFLSE